MTQHPLFPDPPVVTATVTVIVTQEHLDRAEAEGLNPVALAILGTGSGIDYADVIRDGAYACAGGDVMMLRFDRDGCAFVSAVDRHQPVSPVTFKAEVIRP